VTYHGDEIILSLLIDLFIRNVQHGANKTRRSALVIKINLSLGPHPANAAVIHPNRPVFDIIVSVTTTRT